jgi:hypothetical protein
MLKTVRQLMEEQNNYYDRLWDQIHFGYLSTGHTEKESEFLTDLDVERQIKRDQDDLDTWADTSFSD